MVGRNQIDLEPYREQICAWYRTNSSLKSVCERLLVQRNITIKPRTLARRLQEWDVSKQARTNDTPELRLRMKALFFELNLNDREILEVLGSEGYQITTFGLVRLRQNMGLIRRLEESEWIDANDTVRMQIEEEMKNGLIQGYGREYLHAHFKRNGHAVSRFVHPLLCS